MDEMEMKRQAAVREVIEMLPRLSAFDLREVREVAQALIDTPSEAILEQRRARAETLERLWRPLPAHEIMNDLAVGAALAGMKVQALAPMEPVAGEATTNPRALTGEAMAPDSPFRRNP